jgi:hypothetical protein
MKRPIFDVCSPRIRATIVAALACGAAGASAQDRADMDRTQIIGNRELPKVIYIVPWKKPLPGDLSSRPLESILDEALGPVDRDVFRRQVRYDGIMQARTPATGSAASTNVDPVAHRK